MSFRSSDRKNSRGDSRPHGRHSDNRRRSGGRSSKPETGGFRGIALNINENTPIATEFTALGVPTKLAQGLGAMGILEPFPIQAATIGDALDGKDVLGRGRTGSGKTLAFGLPLLARLMTGTTNSRAPRGLILVPTRELAQQVQEALSPLGQLVGLQFSLIIGGAQYSRQIETLRRGADIVVATPGRLEDLINRGDCDLSEVEIAVLDEADQMADMGFLPIVDDLMSQVPRGGQRLLFSATLDRGVDAIVKKHLSDPVEHATEPNAGSVTTMEHHVFLVEPRDKFKVVRTIATREGRCIAFVRTQAAADDICDELTSIGVAADALHGGKSQGARTKALKNLKEGRISVLVATDVAARGIHVDDIDLVLNIDMPRDFKDYLHRAGRTARAGANGLVVSITLAKQARITKQLMSKAGVEPEYHHVDMDSDIVSELTGAKEVIAFRPGSRGDDRDPRELPRDERAPRREERSFNDRPARRDDRPRDAARPQARQGEAPRRARFDSDRPRRDDRPARNDRPFGDRPARVERSREDSAPRRWEDRPPRRDDRSSDRAPRRDDRNSNDRPPRSFDRNSNDRAPRRDDRNSNDRAPRSFDRSRDDSAPRRWEDRAPRRDDRNSDRAPRRLDGRSDDRAPRRDDRNSDRAPRRLDGRSDDRAPRRDDRSRDDRGASRWDSPRRDDRGRDDRAPRRDDRNRDDRATARKPRVRSGEGASASNRAARRAHLQPGNTVVGKAKRGADANAGKGGRKGKPRPKNRKASR